MKVAGLDLSLTSTGVALVDGTTVALCPPARKLAKGEKRTTDDDMERLDWLRCEITWRLAEAYRADLVVVEGYSYGSSANREKMGELGGIIRFALWEHRIPWVAVPPSTAKMFATGKGAADKTTVALKARDCGWTGDTDDEADAAWLRWIGLYAHGVHEVPRTAYRDAVVAKLGWGVTEGAVA